MLRDSWKKEKGKNKVCDVDAKTHAQERVKEAVCKDFDRAYEIDEEESA